MTSHYKGTAQERLALDAFVKLSRAAESVGARVNDHLYDDGLSVSQFGVLEALYHLGPMPAGRLAGKILRSSANLTLVVDNLVKRGLVTRERRPDDRRAVEIALTDDGRVLIAAILPDHVAGVVAALSALSPDEQTTLAALCRKLGLAQTAACD
ncbi:MAG: MarR family transcriptional regulator [Anaerolineae bacterium]|nr:MarR family transcriptional regulator [Anaerolineae bacterium]